MAVFPTMAQVQTQANSTGTSPPCRAAVALFLAISCLYLLLARGRITSIDEWHVYGTAESLVERGSWELRLPGAEPASAEDGNTKSTVRRFSRYSPIPSLLAAPFIRAALPLVNRWPEPAVQKFGGLPDPSGSTNPPLTRRDLLQAVATIPSAVITAATGVVIFVGLVRLGVAVGAALATVLVFALGTLALPYSGSLYVQPVAAFGLIGVVFSVVRARDAWMVISLWFLLSVRLECVFLAPALALHLVRYRQPAARPLAWLCVALAAGVGTNIAINCLRGDPLLVGDYGGEAFTTPVLLGLHGLLFSPGKGLIWFAPAAALGLVLMPSLFRGVPPVGQLAAGISATLLIMSACWWTWHGGWSWGPRLILPLMPVLVLPFGWVFQSWHERSGGIRCLIVGIILVSIAVQIRAAMTDPTGDRTAMGMLLGGNENESIYIPQVGPWGAATQGSPDLFVCRLWSAMPRLRPALTVIIVGLALACASFTWFTLHSVQIRLVHLRELMPRPRPIELLGLALALLVTAAPPLVSGLLHQSAPRPASIIDREFPRQYDGMSWERSGRRLIGKLYIPLKGDYLFYQQGWPGTQFILDSRPLLQGVEAGISAKLVQSLDVGFHKLEIEGSVSGHFNILYWTTPGNAHYKEPIPRCYLAGPGAAWRERAAIAVENWNWIVWVLAVVGLLYLPVHPSCCAGEPRGRIVAGQK